MIKKNIPPDIGLDMSHILLPQAISNIKKELYIARKHDSILRQPIRMEIMIDGRYISAYY